MTAAYVIAEAKRAAVESEVKSYPLRYRFHAQPRLKSAIGKGGGRNIAKNNAHG